jgi:NADPH:quinone reductase-like Zn-dependent oxidoreductase
VRAFHLDRFKDLSSLTVREHDVPEPGPHEVLVRVRAASLNYRDLMIVNGTYPVPVSEGVIPLSDGAGEVVAVGEGASRVAVGDRVCSTYFLGYVDGPLTLAATRHQLGASHDGMLAEYRLLHEDWVVHTPKHLSFEEAATLPCAALTAWSALTGPRPVRAGDTVLTLGTGGVALFAVQLAVVLGARVIAATSSAQKAETLTALGATHVLNYQSRSDWHTDITEFTGGRGVEHIVETVGPATLEQSIRSVAFDGHIAMIGVFSGNTGALDPKVFAGRLFSLRRIAVGSRVGLEALCRVITEHGLHPVIDRVYEFTDAPAAYKHFHARQHIGKVVISGYGRRDS